jgi:hypothetical protein
VNLGFDVTCVSRNYIKHLLCIIIIIIIITIIIDALSHIDMQQYTRDNKSKQNCRRKCYIDLAIGNVLESNQSKLLNIREGQGQCESLRQDIIKTDIK